MQQEDINEPYQNAISALASFRKQGSKYFRSFSASELIELLSTLSYAHKVAKEQQLKIQLEGLRDALSSYVKHRQNKQTYKFSILAIFATLILIAINYQYKLIQKLKDPKFKVPWIWMWIWIAIGILFALLIIAAVYQCCTVYEYVQRCCPQQQQQPRKQLEEEPKQELEGKQGEGYGKLNEEAEDDVNPPQ